MKTSSVSNKQLTESGVNSRIGHRSFLEHTAKAPNTKTRKMIRRVDKANQSVFALLGLQDYTARTKVAVHPEFVAYAFHLYGLSRKLFLYIIFYELNNDTCRFVIDNEMMRRFAVFCRLFGEEDETDKTILQAVRSLVRKNTMHAVEQNEYMLNPLIAGGSNESKRRKLIDVYCKLLQSKGLDTAVHFYPRYQVTL